MPTRLWAKGMAYESSMLPVGAGPSSVATCGSTTPSLRPTANAGGSGTAAAGTTTTGGSSATTGGSAGGGGSWAATGEASAITKSDVRILVMIVSYQCVRSVV